jgi:hypothetical protein
MAKMFYTLEEAAAKLGKSEGDVRKMAESGQLQEFRDRDKLMFKVEQVDLLAGGKDDDDMIPLAESGEQDAITLSSSGTNMSLSPDTKESTGISIFEADATEEADPSAVTRVTPAIGGGLGLADSGGFTGGSGGSGSGSGSGLMDLAREKDDTSLGADLLEDVYGSNAGGAAAGTVEEAAVASEGDGGGLFETSAGAPGVVDTGAAAAGALPMAAFAEVYDGPGSGLVGGAALGGALALIVGVAAAAMRLAGASTDLFAGASPFVLLGALAGVILVCTVLGWVLGKRG